MVGVERRVSGWVLVVSTLLGFEGSAACLVVGLLAGLRWLPCLGAGVGGRLFLENFTVDASIFVVFVLFWFDKLLSAIGGCLGTKSR